MTTKTTLMMNIERDVHNLLEYFNHDTTDYGSTEYYRYLWSAMSTHFYEFIEVIPNDDTITFILGVTYKDVNPLTDTTHDLLFPDIFNKYKDEVIKCGGTVEIKHTSESYIFD